jgi:hypothetical protein
LIISASYVLFSDFLAVIVSIKGGLVNNELGMERLL